MKTCSRCRISKPETEFYRNRALADGLMNQCKDCHKVNQRRMLDLPASREARRQATARWRARHPEYKNPRDRRKTAARLAVWKAVTTGVLVRPERCECCLQPLPLQAHHHRGYSRERELDVVWACAPCHGFLHRES